jgi:hypothetical protein
MSEVGSRGLIDVLQVDVEVLESQFPHLEVASIGLEDEVGVAIET